MADGTMRTSDFIAGLERDNAALIKQRDALVAALEASLELLYDSNRIQTVARDGSCVEGDIRTLLVQIEDALRVGKGGG